MSAPRPASGTATSGDGAGGHGAGGHGAGGHGAGGGLRTSRVAAAIRRLSSGRGSWILRLVELPATLILVAVYHGPGSHGAVVAGLLAVTSAAWVVWLWATASPPADPELNRPSLNRPAVGAMLVAAATSGAAIMVDGSGWASVFTSVAALSAGVSLEPGVAASVPLVGIAAVEGGALVFGGSLGAALGYPALFVAVTLGGVARGLRRDQVRQATLLLHQQERTQAEQERGAALAERTRIAREIHDILAHSLADLSIQLEVADALLSDRADVPGALARIRHAHRLAGEGIEETRRAVHALRSDVPPLPDALAAMVAAHRRDTAVVSDLEVEGTPRALTAATGLALVRTAQEALTNTRKHAPGVPVSLHLGYEADHVRLTVTDRYGADQAPVADGHGRDPVPVGVDGGYGLAGMHERLRLVGGVLSAGPVPGGWVVQAEVPG